jgi:hypothetical protein
VAATLRYFLLPDDERALFRHLARHGLTVYPELVAPGWRAPRADETVLPALDGPAYYLAAERLGPVVAHPVKRGPDRGMLRIQEVPSPVLHYQRSLPNQAGELVAGRLWVDLEGADAATSEPGKPYALRLIFEDLHSWCRKTLRRSDPKGWWVGPRAAQAWKRRELVLREEGHKGRAVGVWK